MKYYIKKTNLQTGTVEYYKNKTIAAWMSEGFKNYCWRFSKQGATNIIKRYNAFEDRHGGTHKYELEPAEE